MLCIRSYTAVHLPALQQLRHLQLECDKFLDPQHKFQDSQSKLTRLETLCIEAFDYGLFLPELDLRGLQNLTTVSLNCMIFQALHMPPHCQLYITVPYHLFFRSDIWASKLLVDLAMQMASLHLDALNTPNTCRNV